MNENERKERIQKHRADMPERYRRNYDKAVRGKSLAAGVKASCLECCQWQQKEITKCTCCACPLYTYRPYSNRNKSKTGKKRELNSGLKEYLEKRRQHRNNPVKEFEGNNAPGLKHSSKRV